MKSQENDHATALKNAQMSLSLAQGLADEPMDECKRMWIRAAVASVICELEALPDSLRPTLPELEHARWNRSGTSHFGDPAGLRCHRPGYEVHQ